MSHVYAANQSTLPAEYGTIKVLKQVAAPEIKRIPIPAEYQTVTRTELRTEGHMEWQAVMCETNAFPGVVMSIQKSLKAAGHYPGEIDGVIGKDTITSIRSFQQAKGLPVGQLTMKTLDALGVQLSR